jgi:hypothetical protein
MEASNALFFETVIAMRPSGDSLMDWFLNTTSIKLPLVFFVVRRSARQLYTVDYWVTFSEGLRRAK